MNQATMEDKNIPVTTGAKRAPANNIQRVILARI
jgi:hypothetical protein